MSATTAVLRSPTHLPSSPSTSLSCNSNDGARQARTILSPEPSNVVGGEEGGLSLERKSRGGGERAEVEQQLSLLALLLAVCRKSLVRCRAEREEELCSMDISPPMNVRHIAHVTFDRFHGFLGLPVEFEPEVPTRAPSASTSVFGVSTESMQCTYDPRGNSVPTILILMQRRLYEQGGLQAEGIFRIAADNSQEEHVRDQLNSGIVPGDIDVHCLACLIKAWFRELPTGVLDSLSPEEVMQCKSEEQYAKLAKLLPPTEAGLLDWAINLMADVVQVEPQNKMNAHSIAVVFAPNMTKMEDPMTALMHAVQVMNFLRTMIMKTLRERQEPILGNSAASRSEPPDDHGHHNPSRLYLDADGEQETEHVHNSTSDAMNCYQTSCGMGISSEFSRDEQPCEVQMHIDSSTNGVETAVDGPKAGIHVISFHRNILAQSSNSLRQGAKMVKRQLSTRMTLPLEKSAGICIVTRLNSRMERVEAWR